jgi:ribosomal protein L13E
MARPIDAAIFKVTEGPLATIRTCLFCKHSEIVRKGRPNVGRGYGLSEGNKARGRMIQHIKAAHPSEYESAARKRAA